MPMVFELCSLQQAARCGKGSKVLEVVEETVRLVSFLGQLYAELPSHLILGPLLGLLYQLAPFILEFASTDAQLEALTNDDDQVDCNR